MMVVLPLNSNSLNLLLITGCKIAPDPFPPSIVIDITFSISKFCWSTKISFTLPLITGWTRAVVPVPGDDIVICGKSITSKFVPWFKILNSDRGP